jgi:hypothetical protein
MRLKLLIVFIEFCLAFLNLVIYINSGHHWWNLAAAAFCGAYGIWAISIPVN